MIKTKVALITGAAKRIGAHIAKKLHEEGLCIALHYRHSVEEAQQLCQTLNTKRPQSAILIQGNLCHVNGFSALLNPILHTWGRLDVLINNASSFYSTPFHQASLEQWQELLDSNLKAPFFLAQATAPYLKEQKGCIINMVDIQATQPLKDYSIYCVAKAGLIMATKALAKELGPFIRVNALAPGIILWPEKKNNPWDKNSQQKIVSRSILKRCGTPDDVAHATLFLIEKADFITGQVIAIDGGRSLNY